MQRKTLHYRDAKVSPSEDLNIYNHTIRIIKYCWYNIDRFPTVQDITAATGYSDRGIRHLVAAHNLPNRMTLRSELKLH
jgi:hypothetical protein